MPYKQIRTHLRVNVSKNQSLNQRGISRNPSIWLISTHIVQFFTLILVVLSIFRRNYRMQGYGSLKFWQTRPQKKIHNFLISEQNRMGFSALDSPWKTTNNVVTTTCYHQQLPTKKFISENLTLADCSFSIFYPN